MQLEKENNSLGLCLIAKTKALYKRKLAQLFTEAVSFSSLDREVFSVELNSSNCSYRLSVWRTALLWLKIQ